MRHPFTRVRERGTGPAWFRLLTPFVALIVLAAATSAYHAKQDSSAADRLFARMVATDELPWNVRTSRIAARTLVESYPESRWASEAWRVIALDAESRCDTGTASAAWESFAGAFEDGQAPGAAFGHYNLGRLKESGGDARGAEGHFRTAIRVIGSHESGVQTWIAADSARSIARIKRRACQWAETNAWKMRADHLARIDEDHTIEEEYR